MNKIAFATVFIFFSLSQLRGQSKIRIIKHIDHIVAAINADSSVEKIVIDIKADAGQVAENPRQVITVARKENRILKISVCDNCKSTNTLIRPEGGIFIDYYLVNEELCFINRLDQDYSRPGSCGYVSINHSFYFKKDRLIKSVKRGYNPCEPLGEINKDSGTDFELSNFRRLLETVKTNTSHHPAAK